MADYRTMLVAYDFSPHSEAALETAADLARRLNADLHLVHVVQTPVFAYGAYGGPAVPVPIDMAQVHDGALTSLREVAEGVADLPGRHEAHVVEGVGIAALVRETAEQLGADLIVMGTHGRTGLAHAFLGSVAERTLRGAPCPVLTVPARADDEGR
jgi:nucleotide-binding universal stress UspA family protein